MIICPHCGAENPDTSAFCSLCLARFTTDSGQAVPPGAQKPPPRHIPSPPAAQYTPAQAGPRYVSPGDYAALRREMSQGWNAAQNAQSYRDSAYYQAAMQHPGSMTAVKAPPWAGKRSITSIVLLVLSYSFLMYLLNFTVNFLISLFILGAAFGGSEAGFSLGVGVLYAADALILVLSGFLISAKAMDRGKGWMYGVACVAAIVFVWEPLIAFIASLFMTGRVFVPIFNLAGILIALFLYLPLGALGGWLAEKRYMG